VLGVLVVQAAGYGADWRGDGRIRASRRKRIDPGVFWLGTFQCQLPLTVS